MGLLRRIAWSASIVWHYALQRQKVEMAYRSDFFINMGISLFYSVVQIFFIWAIFSRVQAVAGWTFEEVLLIYGLGQVSFGYYAVFFFDMIIGFSDRYIIEGDLDRPLLRPLHPLFQLAMENIALREFNIVLKGTAITLYAMAHIEPQVPITAGNILLIQLFGIIGSIVLSGLFLTVASISFWIKDRVGFTSPLFSINEAARWPITIYHPAVQIVFCVIIPVAYGAFFPAVYFINPQQWIGWLIAGPFIAIAVFLFGAFVFNRGLRVYESTGS